MRFIPLSEATTEQDKAQTQPLRFVPLEAETPQAPAAKICSTFSA